MPIEAALVGVRHDAGVHQRGSGVTVFVAEIGADHLLPLVADTVERQVEHGADFFEALQEDLASLPVALLEIMHDRLQLASQFAIVELEDRVNESACPAVIGRALPGKVEGPDNDPRRIRLEPKRMELRLNHGPLGGGEGPRFCGDAVILSSPFASTKDLPHG